MVRASKAGNTTFGSLDSTNQRLAIGQTGVPTSTIQSGGSMAAGTTTEVTFSAGNAAFANLLSSLYLTTTSNTVTLNYTGLALGLGTAFKGFYHVGGY